MSTITMIAEELNFWRGRLEEFEQAGDATLSDDAVSRIAALERVLGYYHPETADEARFIAGLLVDFSSEIERDHLGAPGAKSLLTKLARSLLAHLDDNPSPAAASVTNQASLSEALLADLSQSWNAAAAIDKELLTLPRGDKLKAKEDEAFARIDALEGALAAARPTSSRDAAILGHLLVHELQYLDELPLERRSSRIVSMISKNLKEFLAALAGTSDEFLPAAYRVKKRAASQIGRDVGAEVSSGPPH